MCIRDSTTPGPFAIVSDEDDGRLCHGCLWLKECLNPAPRLSKLVKVSEIGTDPGWLSSGGSASSKPGHQLHPFTYARRCVSKGTGGSCEEPGTAVAGDTGLIRALTSPL